MQNMKLSEVAAFLGKSIAQTRRYMDSGLLPAHKVGKELLFARAAVIEFARERGIRTAGSEVPEGNNPTLTEFIQVLLKNGAAIVPADKISMK
jgi:hypothetical protein